jgi:hypothetical protein
MDAFLAEVGGWSQQKSSVIKIVLYADHSYAQIISRLFQVGTQVAVAACVDTTTGEIRESFSEVL